MLTRGRITSRISASGSVQGMREAPKPIQTRKHSLQQAKTRRPFVSKSRGKSESPKLPADHKSAGAGGVTSWDSPAAQWGIMGLVAVAFLAYLTVFFSQALAPGANQSRLSLFSYLLTPDDLASTWVEGNW